MDGLDITLCFPPATMIWRDSPGEINKEYFVMDHIYLSRWREDHVPQGWIYRRIWELCPHQGGQFPQVCCLLSRAAGAKRHYNLEDEKITDIIII